MKVEDERYSRKIKVKVGGKKENAKRKQEEKGEKCKLKVECIRVKSARKISNGINSKSEKIKEDFLIEKRCVGCVVVAESER